MKELLYHWRPELLQVEVVVTRQVEASLASPGAADTPFCHLKEGLRVYCLIYERRKKGVECT